MRFRLIRSTLAVLFAVLAVVGFAGTLTVTSPTSGSFISPTTSITYNISGAVVQVTVTVTTTFPNGQTTTSTQQVLPSSTGTASGTVAANISSSAPEGSYKIEVSASEPHNSYAPTLLVVTLLPLAPQFNSFSPPDQTFENGTVKIRAAISDDHLQLWTVQVNGANIPNNTGTSNLVAVNWDTSGVSKDGPQTITITATDQANQTTTITSTVTLCRTPPIVTIEYPGTQTVLLPGSDIVVSLSIQGEFANSIDKTGVDVRVMSASNAYLTRVPFTSLVSSSSNPNVSIWSGRIRYAPGRLPSTFRLLVTCVDKAGNGASPQMQTVHVGS